MPLIKIINWIKVDSIKVDPNNPQSKVDRGGTIINPIPTSSISVELLIDGVRNKIRIDPPYSRQKVIDAINLDTLPRRKTDEGVEFTI